MLESMRKALKGWVGKVLIAFFTLPFLFFGISSVFSSLSAKSDEVSVNGIGINSSQISNAVANNKEQMRQRFGENFDPSFFPDEKLRIGAISQLVNQELSKQYANDNGLYASFEKVSEGIRQMPNFLDEDGQFSQEIFDAILAQQNLSTKQVVQLVQGDMKVAQTKEILTRSSFVLESEARAFELLQQQKRDIAYLSLKVKDFEKNIVIEDEKIKDYYDANLNEFMVEEKVSVDYLELRAKEFNDKVEVTDEQIENAYQTHLATLADKQQRKASHILINVDDKTSESDALEKIKAAEAELRAGKDFSAVAREYSQDPGSADSGGDLGLAGKGAYVPEFEDVLYSLEEGEVSSPVLSEFGYHLIKLVEIADVEVPSLAKEKPALLKTLQSSGAYDLYQEKIDSLEELIYTSTTLADSAELLGKPVSVSKLFTRSQGEGFTTNKEVREIAFSNEILNQGENSAIIEINDGHVAVLRLNTHQTQEPKSLADVTSLIKEKLKNQTARANLLEKSDALVAMLNEGKSSSEVEFESGTAWTVKEAVKRSEAGVPRSLLQQAFKMERPAEGQKTVAKASEPNGDISILTLTKVSDSTAELSAAELKMTKERLSRSKQYKIYQDYLANLKAAATININEAPAEDATLPQ